MKLDEGWRCFYPGDPQITLDAVIEEEAGKSRKNIVVGKFDARVPDRLTQVSIACGDATFTQSIRRKVLEIMSKDNIIVFAEVEYRPQGDRNRDDAASKSIRLSRKKHARVTTLNYSEEVELTRFSTKARNGLGKSESFHENDIIENAVRPTAFV
jgi:hypothetical protein